MNIQTSYASSGKNVTDIHFHHLKAVKHQLQFHVTVLTFSTHKKKSAEDIKFVGMFIIIHHITFLQVCNHTEK
jgi:uncharacterized membrane protein